MSEVSRQSGRLTTPVLIAFGCVYLFWGSTYLAMRFGVELLPPLVMGTSRYLIAGVLMLGFCRLRGLNLKLTGREALIQAAIGVLMLTFGNVGIMYAERTLASGLSALIVAVVPLYVALYETITRSGEGLRTRGWVGIGIGVVGLLVLLSPGLTESRNGDSRQMMGGLIALGSAFCWTAGSLVARHKKMQISPMVSAGWQMLIAGAFSGVLMLLLGETNQGLWKPQAYGAIAYLVVFGSLVGYTAYIYLLEHVPVAKVSTYAYINPVVAVILGALLLHERFVGVEYVGMAAILAAVFLVTSSKLKTEVRRDTAVPVEAEA